MGVVSEPDHQLGHCYITSEETGEDEREDIHKCQASSELLHLAHKTQDV